jgi:hypothetical protein
VVEHFAIESYMSPTSKSLHILASDGSRAKIDEASLATENH